MRLKKLIMINRAPFEKLILDFDDENIAVLSGINGAGKTTIISHIVDAFYELAKKAFFNEFENKTSKFYRVSSTIYSLDMEKPAIVYLRFSQNENTNIDYVDVWGKCSEDEYTKMIDIENPIKYSSIDGDIKKQSLTKHWSISDSDSDEKKIEQYFNDNIITYFPSYRYEQPYYLNDLYKVELKFKTNANFTGYLPNPIEVTSDLPNIANWIMDVVLDLILQESSAITVGNNLNLLLSNILELKLGYKVNFAVAHRNTGATRIAIMKAGQNVRVYPSIFTMSSGELALLCLFGELIKQADKIGKTCENVSGIVLVDEIDKHLHIKLQKDILPKLIQMFPKIQFIVSSHSPFLGLGLDNNLSYKIFDLDNEGISCPPQNNEPFREAYEVMIKENEQFAKLYRQLQEQIGQATKPIIITEGKTDWKHLKAAMKKLDINDLDIEFYEFNDPMGDTVLIKLLKDYSRIRQSRKIIGIFDRDNFNNLSKDQNFSDRLKTEEYISMENNVFAFAIPIANENIYGVHTSIEHYYKKDDLTKETQDGKRLFLGEEFFESGQSRDRQHPYCTECKEIQNKVAKNGVIDQKVYDTINDPQEKNSLALSKDDFAQLIFDEDDFAENFDFSCFQAIFDIIRKICNI